MCEDDELADLARARADFVKRLFAVTLSVGIANQLSQLMKDSGNLSFLVFVEHKWRSLTLLCISLAIVVTSWQGYHRAIKKLPLKDVGRFYIDIALVFLYLLLTLSTDAPSRWFSMHAAIFILYLAWDWLRSRLPDYKQRPHLHERSMTITIVWLIYFLVIWLQQSELPFFATSTGFALIALAALAGVILYREDKTKHWGWKIKLTTSILPLGIIYCAATIRL
jgi:hypothetical protein